MTPRELYYQVGKETVLHQNALRRELSDRAFNLLNLGVATIAAGGVVVNLQLKTLDWDPVLMALGAMSLFAFAVVAVLSFWIMRGGDWFAFPPLEQIAARIAAYHEADYLRATQLVLLEVLQIYAGDYFQDAFFRNEQVLDGKRLAQFWTFLALALEITAVICLVVLIFWGTQTLPCGEGLTQTVQCVPVGQ